MNSPISENITAIIVAFHPDVEQLRLNCSRLLEQVHQILIVDNSGSNSNLEELELPDDVFILKFDKNKGVGTALNAGVEWAEEKGADFALLLDQDSEITGSMVNELSAAMIFLLERKNQVAAVGPQAFSHDTIKPEPFKCIKRRVNDSIVEVSYLHTSGTLIDIEIFKRIGNFLEPFFIDMIDIEWCFRAAQQKLHCYGVENTKIFHEVGEKKAICGYQLSVHFPLRTYYQVRNWLLLRKKDYIPKIWWFHYGLRHILARSIFLLALTPQKKERFQYLLKGCWHGIYGKDDINVQ